MRAIEAVTFFGSSNAESGTPLFKIAKKIAKRVAETHRKVINGGGPGIMLAATMGAKEANGKTTVVYYKPELATTFEGRSAVNFADKHTEEANYVLRTKKLLELGDAYIIFKGGTGTISEFGMAWGLARLYFGHHKPLILYGDFWHDIINSIKKNMIIRKESLNVFKIVKSEKETIRALENFDNILEKNRHDHKKCPGFTHKCECDLLL